MPETGALPLGAFVVAGLLLNLTPGPDLAYTASMAARGGHRTGWVAALGISTGCLAHVALGAIGLTALLAASATAFALLKLAGAAWLVWLGWRMLRSPAGAAPTAPRAGVARRPLSAVFREGVLVNLLNPKVALFFLAFVPQFIDPARGNPTLAFLLLGVLIVVNGTLITGALGTLAAVAARRLRERADRGGRSLRALQRLLPRLVGAALVGMGVRLALEPR